MSDPGRTTRLLRRLIDADEAAADELAPLVYDELRAIAGRLMQEERRDHTLQPTALIGEAWLRLLGGADASFEDRGHFVRVAARAMRRVLVDHARARRTAKRGEGRQPVALAIDVAGDARDPTDLLALDEALEQLGARDAQLLRVVELRYFGGLTHQETADVLDLSERQVRLAWTSARGWLRRELARGGAADG